MADYQESATIKVFGLVFDITSGIVSLLDLTTDIIILTTWYNQDRMTFFWISISILILAQLSYVTVFYYYHASPDFWDDTLRSFISVLFTLPFAPFLSFIFWAVSDSDSLLRDFIDAYLLCYDFDWNEWYISDTKSVKSKWIERTLYKHLGFICEALIEGK